MARIVDTQRAEHRRLVRHYLEMLGAMVAGMVVFGALVRMVVGVSGHEGLLDHPGARAPIMATNMVVGMSVWMRHRGHDWPATAEMAASMYVPLVVLLVPFWVGVLPGGALLGGMHILMLPAMWLVMLRRRAEYSHDHAGIAELPLAHTN